MTTRDRLHDLDDDARHHQAEPEAGSAPGKRTLTDDLMKPRHLIVHSVGEGARNDARDVGAIQRALARHGHDPGGIDGRIGPHTITAIKAFQATIITHPDGLVEPGGKTERCLSRAPQVAAVPNPEPTKATGHEEARAPVGDTTTTMAKNTADAVDKPTNHTNDTADPFHVDEGQLTFDAEGSEGGKYHTRKAHWPGGASGVTIGRGYDLGAHTRAKIVEDLTATGVREADASKYAAAAGLKGNEAKTWLAKHKHDLVEITAEQQEELFETTYEEHLDDVKRISGRYAKNKAKPGKSAAAFEVDFDHVHPVIKDILVDLRYRGDYTPATRKHVQPAAIANDLVEMAAIMADPSLWNQVPRDRFERRKRYMQQALAALTTGSKHQPK